eukprot:m.61876 g.61876  ORF g.61876 m.61876 type:complete len:228 (+) comp17622_c0_seq2:394-1077(+)
MPPKKGKRGTGSKDPSPVKKGSKVLTVQDPAQETDDTTSPPPKSINKKPSLLGRLRGKDKSGKSPATSPLPNRKKTRGSKKNEDGGRDSNDILIADAAVFEAQLPDFDKLPMTEGELDEATKHNMDGSSPEIIADFIAMATAEDGPDTPKKTDTDEADWESTSGPPRPPKTEAVQTHSTAVDATTFLYIDQIDTAFPTPLAEAPPPPVTPFFYIDLIDRASELALTA